MQLGAMQLSEVIEGLPGVENRAPGPQPTTHPTHHPCGLAPLTCANRPRQLRRASRKRLRSRARSCWYVSAQPCTRPVASSLEPCRTCVSGADPAVGDRRVSAHSVGT